MLCYFCILQGNGEVDGGALVVVVVFWLHCVGGDGVLVVWG